TMRTRRPSELIGPAKLTRTPLLLGRAPPSHCISALCQSRSRLTAPRIFARRKPLPVCRQPSGSSVGVVRVAAGAAAAGDAAAALGGAAVHTPATPAAT